MLILHATWIAFKLKDRFKEFYKHNQGPQYKVWIFLELFPSEEQGRMVLLPKNIKKQRQQMDQDASSGAPMWIGNDEL